MLSKVKGKKEAIIEAEKLNLIDNGSYYSLLGNLYTNLDNTKALQYFQTARTLSSSNAYKSGHFQKYRTDNCFPI